MWSRNCLPFLSTWVHIRLVVGVVLLDLLFPVVCFVYYCLFLFLLAIFRFATSDYTFCSFKLFSDSIEVIDFIGKRQRSPKGQLRMDNTEIHATLGTQDEDKQNRKQNKTQKSKKMSNTDPPNKRRFSQILAKVIRY